MVRWLKWLWLGVAVGLLIGCAGPAVELPAGELYFLRRGDMDWTLVAMASDGTETVVRAGIDDYALGPRLAVVLNDETTVAFGDGDRLETLATCASPCRTLSWSPDGRWLLWTEGGGTQADLYVREHLTGQIQAAGRVWSVPVWSPEGGRIAYTGKGGLIVLDVEQGTTATVALEFQGPPAWNPDGQNLALVLDNGSVVQVQPGQTFPVPLALPDGRSLIDEVAWNPSGAELAVLRVRYTPPAEDEDSAGVHEEIGAETLGAQPWLLSVADGQWRALPGDPAAVFAHLAWAPDGKRLAMVRMPIGTVDPEPEIWIVDVSQGSVVKKIPGAVTPFWGVK